MYFLLGLWLVCAILAVGERKILGMIVYLGVFSTISSVCFLLFGAPDVAMAEAAVSTFSTVFLIICFEQYFKQVNDPTQTANNQVQTANNPAQPSNKPAQTANDKAQPSNKPVQPLNKPVQTANDKAQPANKPNQKNPSNRKILQTIKNRGVALVFVLFLFGLFIYFVPDTKANTYVKDLYISGFMNDVGGENSVTAIYLGYRMYDTLFEALMLLVSVVAVTHMSWYGSERHEFESLRGVGKSDKIAIYTIRLVCPAILLFGIYLIFNGHISPGGGFQGGVAIAIFFVCRYLIHNIDDMKSQSLMIAEKLTFAAIIILAACFILLGLHTVFPQVKELYLILMNILIGTKVACGFTVIFYRYIAFERR